MDMEMPRWKNKNEIDFILSNAWVHIRKVEVVKCVDIGNDHRPVGVELIWKDRQRCFVHRGERRHMKSIELIQGGFESKLREKLS